MEDIFYNLPRKFWLCPNLWGAVIGRPGIMKSPAIRQSVKFLQRLEIEAKGDFEKAQQSYADLCAIADAQNKLRKSAIADAVKEKKDPIAAAGIVNVEEPKEPTRRRYLVSDSTVEKLGDEAWKAAPWTDDFVDIEGDFRIKPRFRTRVKMLWDEQYLYIGAELQEPHVQATYTQRDSYIFHEDNDFEVFLNRDGNNHNYAELEMNAFNTVWDLRLKKPYRDKVKAEDDWDIPGLKTAVHGDGTINNPRDVDKGWTIEIAIPREIVKALNDKPVRTVGQLDSRFSITLGMTCIARASFTHTHGTSPAPVQGF